MKKMGLSFVLLALLISSPQTAQPKISSKVVLPVSIILTIAGGIATTYCYKQEKNILEELAKLNATAEEIENSVVETTPNDIAALKELLEQKKTRFLKGKWICGGVTLASLLAAVISGIKVYRQPQPTPDPQPQPIDPQAQLQQKIALGGELEPVIRQLIIKLREAGAINTRLRNEIEALNQDILAKIDAFNGIDIPNAQRDDNLAPFFAAIGEYNQKAPRVGVFRQLVNELIPENPELPEQDEEEEA